jgi:hypothetical protein
MSPNPGQISGAFDRDSNWIATKTIRVHSIMHHNGKSFQEMLHIILAILLIKYLI